MTICNQCNGKKGETSAGDSLIDLNGVVLPVAPGIGAVPCSQCGGTGVLTNFGVA